MHIAAPTAFGRPHGLILRQPPFISQQRTQEPRSMRIRLVLFVVHDLPVCSTRPDGRRIKRAARGASSARQSANWEAVQLHHVGTRGYAAASCWIPRLCLNMTADHRITAGAVSFYRSQSLLVRDAGAHNAQHSYCICVGPKGGQRAATRGGDSVTVAKSENPGERSP